jgi:hypothetical protein
VPVLRLDSLFESDDESVRRKRQAERGKYEVEGSGNYNEEIYFGDDDFDPSVHLDSELFCELVDMLEVEFQNAKIYECILIFF